MDIGVSGAAILAAIFLLVGLLLGLLLKRKPQVPPQPPRPPCPEPKVPDKFNEQMLTSTLALRLTGAPADGSVGTGQAASKVIWVDRGDEVLVHLDSMQTRILDRTLLVSVDLETDQTGKTPLVVAFSLGNPDDPAGLVMVTDDLPRGDGLLASRWGRTLQDAVWASVLELAKEHASERQMMPAGLAASQGVLHLRAAEPVTVAPAVRNSQ